MDDQLGDLLAAAEAANGGQPILLASGASFSFDFDPEGDLVLVFANGGRIVIQDLGNLADQENAPSFEIAGTEIPGGTRFGRAVALTEGEAGPEVAATLETAAGGEAPDRIHGRDNRKILSEIREFRYSGPTVRVAALAAS